MAYPQNDSVDSSSSPLSREHILLKVDPDVVQSWVVRVMGVLAEIQGLFSFQKGVVLKSWGTDSKCALYFLL